MLWGEFQKAPADWFRAKVNMQVLISHRDYDANPADWRNYWILMKLVRFNQNQMTIYNNYRNRRLP
jgi:hypothetical protein